MAIKTSVTEVFQYLQGFSLFWISTLKKAYKKVEKGNSIFILNKYTIPSLSFVGNFRKEVIGES